MLAAGDQAPGRQLKGDLNPFLGDRRDFFIARGQYSLGRSSYVGGILTDTQFAGGHNRVAGADVSLRWGRQGATATLLSTHSLSPDGTDGTSGNGGGATYFFESKSFVFGGQGEHYDRGFRMDTAFLRQVGITQGWVYAAPSFYPDAKKHPWLKRIQPFVFFQYGRDRIQGGDPWVVVPGLRMNFTRQGFFRIDVSPGEEPFLHRTFRTHSTRIQAEAQATRWLNFSAQSSFGRSIFYDEIDPYLGRHQAHTLEVTLQPSPRFNEKVSYNRVAFDRLTTGDRVFTVNVVNTQTTFQLDRHVFFRGIVQYDSSRARVLTDLLASWELLPGTVAYGGYGSLIERREWDGQVWTPGTGAYRTSQRGLFFKAAYVHRF